MIEVGVVHANDDSKRSSSTSSTTSDGGKNHAAGSIDGNRQEKSRIRPAALQLTCEQTLTTASNRSIQRHTKGIRWTRRRGKILVRQNRRTTTTMSSLPSFNRLFGVHLLLIMSILPVWLQFSQRTTTTTTTTLTTTTTTLPRSTTSMPFLVVAAFLNQYPLHRTCATCPSTSSPSTSSSASTSTSTSLNGVRGFRAWFEKQFPEATCTVDVSQKKDSFDHVLVDMNQILHVVLRKARSEGHAHKLLMMQLDDLVRSARPNHSLVLAIDGAPGAAKLATQRKRRFYILKNTQFKIDHFNKVTSNGTKDEIALLGSSKRKLERRLRAYQSELQSFELAPCTERMKGFEEAILYWAWSRLNSASYDNNGRSDRRPPLLTKQTRVYFSPSTVTGEGEIKLLEWVVR